MLLTQTHTEVLVNNSPIAFPPKPQPETEPNADAPRPTFPTHNLLVLILPYKPYQTNPPIISNSGKILVLAPTGWSESSNELLTGAMQKANHSASKNSPGQHFLTSHAQPEAGPNQKPAFHDWNQFVIPHWTFSFSVPSLSCGHTLNLNTLLIHTFTVTSLYPTHCITSNLSQFPNHTDKP